MPTQDIKVDLLDPDQEPSDEALELLMREMMADVRLSQERIRQKLADQIDEQIRRAGGEGHFMDAELLNLRSKLEDVLEALKMGDIDRAHVAAVELSMRLSHAEAAWQRIKQPKREGWAEASKRIAEAGEDFHDPGGLVARVTPENRHQEIGIGVPVGREALPDTDTVMACGAFLEWVTPRFPVASAILYGSRARGTHRQDSDADLAVILERTDRRRLDIAKAMADLAFDVLLETGINVSPLPVWADEWEHPETHPNPALIENIHREGLAVDRPSVALRKHLAAISAIVTARRCENPRVFGSVLRGEDHIGSDLDLLVDATKGASLLDLGGLQHDLIGLLKVRVQVVTPGDLPEKWRQKVIDDAKPLDWFKT